MSTADPVEEMFNRVPLLLFSPHTASRVQAVTKAGDEFLKIVDAWPVVEPRVFDNFIAAYDLFWFWVLGAFEVVRTMAIRPASFSPSLLERLRQFRNKIAKLRGAFAKQKLPGSGTHSWKEMSVVGFGKDNSDLLFEIEGDNISARALIGDFREIMSSVKRADVLRDINGNEHVS